MASLSRVVIVRGTRPCRGDDALVGAEQSPQPQSHSASDSSKAPSSKARTARSTSWTGYIGKAMREQLRATRLLPDTSERGPSR
jgi:hypothetical protein